MYHLACKRACVDKSLRLNNINNHTSHVAHEHCVTIAAITACGTQLQKNFLWSLRLNSKHEPSRIMVWARHMESARLPAQHAF